MKKLAKAISIAAQAFEDKLDKGGNPYILHCLWVMNAVEGGEDVKCAAVLHDIVEDTNWTIDRLRAEGFSDYTLRLISLLTHTEEMDYMTYIKYIQIEENATKIKLKDLEHNSCITRLKGLRSKDFERLQKYHTAYTYLKN